MGRDSHERNCKKKMIIWENVQTSNQSTIHIKIIIKRLKHKPDEVVVKQSYSHTSREINVTIAPCLENL